MSFAEAGRPASGSYRVGEFETSAKGAQGGAEVDPFHVAEVAMGCHGCREAGYCRRETSMSLCPHTETAPSFLDGE